MRTIKRLRLIVCSNGASTLPYYVMNVSVNAYFGYSSSERRLTLHYSFGL